MSKFTLKIYIFCILLHFYLFKQSHNANKYNIRQLQIKQPNNPKILQTLYSDSPSNNYYYTVLYMGRNLTRRTYLIDTGIDVLSAPCGRCLHCNENHKNYFFSKQRINRRIKCDSELCSMLPSIGCIHHNEYMKNIQCAFLSTKLNGDGMRGYYIKTSLFFEKDKKPNYHNANKVYESHGIPLACSLAQFGKYKNLSTNGVLGLNNKEKSFISVLYNLKIIKKDIFSICIGDRFGYLSIGGIHKEYHKSKKIEYIINTSPNVYQIKVETINIGNVKKRKINSNCEIDSANPISFFPAKLFKKMIKDYEKFLFFKVIKKNIKYSFIYDHDHGYCAIFENNEEMKKQIKLWPKIDIFFSKTKFEWEPENYFYRQTETKACLGIKNHSLNHIIFGNNFLRGNDFIFDKSRNRIGFVKADCSKIISMNTYDDNLNNDADNNTWQIIEEKIKDKKVYKNIKIKNGIEFFMGKNNELANLKEYNLIKKIVNISFLSLIILVIFFIVISIIILYRIIYPKE